MAINPANTGSFYGNYRLTSLYKNQWASISNPYKSAYAALDFSLFENRLGVGASFFSDKAGKSNMGRTLANVSSAYNLKLNDENNFIVGLQYGFGQRSIQTTNLKWDSQFNGVAYDPSLPSYEYGLNEAYSYMDMSAGVLWKFVDEIETELGFAAYHLNQPKKSFYLDDKLDRKFILHSSSLFKLKEKPLFILPQFIYLLQGPHSEINLGGLVRYSKEIKRKEYRMYNRVDMWRKKGKEKEKKNSVAVFAGAQFRFKDAFIAVAGFEIFKSFLVSYSYDVNVSKLRLASSAQGGGELAFTFKGAF